MNPALLIPIFALSIPIVASICGTIATIAGKKSAAQNDPEQTRMIQEIYHGLEHMENRIEALETILFDSGRKEPRP